MIKKMSSVMTFMGLLFLSLLAITSINNVVAYADTTEDIGYYDCWLRADGTTWQKGIQPGSTVKATFTIQTPIVSSKKLKSYNVSFLSDTQGKFTNKYYQYAVDNGNITSYKYLGNSKMQYTIQTTLRAHEIINGLDITKSDQSELVQGRRFYIPVEISWQYESNNEMNGTYHFSIGEPYLQINILEGDTIYTYQLKSSKGEKTNILLSSQKPDGSHYIVYNDPT